MESPDAVDRPRATVDAGAEGDEVEGVGELDRVEDRVGREQLAGVSGQRAGGGLEPAERDLAEEPLELVVDGVVAGARPRERAGGALRDELLREQAGGVVLAVVEEQQPVEQPLGGGGDLHWGGGRREARRGLGDRRAEAGADLAVELVEAVPERELAGARSGPQAGQGCGRDGAADHRIARQQRVHLAEPLARAGVVADALAEVDRDEAVRLLDVVQPQLPQVGDQHPGDAEDPPAVGERPLHRAERRPVADLGCVERGPRGLELEDGGEARVGGIAEVAEHDVGPAGVLSTRAGGVAHAVAGPCGGNA